MGQACRFAVEVEHLDVLHLAGKFLCPDRRGGEGYGRQHHDRPYFHNILNNWFQTKIIIAKVEKNLRTREARACFYCSERLHFCTERRGSG